MKRKHAKSSKKKKKTATRKASAASRGSGASTARSKGASKSTRSGSTRGASSASTSRRSTAARGSSASPAPASPEAPPEQPPRRRRASPMSGAGHDVPMGLGESGTLPPPVTSAFAEDESVGPEGDGDAAAPAAFAGTRQLLGRPGRRLPQVDARSVLTEALREAQQSAAEGGIPIGAVLIDAEGEIVARGHNMRVQNDDPTAHAEITCLRHAGRRTDWRHTTLVTTLSPCMLCTGAVLQLGIGRVIIGENRNFLGSENLLRQNGVKLTVAQDPRCIELMERFIDEQPELWGEDISE